MKITYKSLFLLLLFSSCRNKRIYDHYIPLNDFKWAEKTTTKCSHFQRNDLEIQLTHPYLNEKNSKDFSLYIDLGDTLYAGPYRKNLFVPSVPFCMDNGGDMVSLRIALVDKNSRKVYIWQNENTYALFRYKRISIKLKDQRELDVDNGAFDVVLQ
jgi:hypothetical protein